MSTPDVGGAVRGLVAVVGFLVLVEVASGVLQGFYTPIYPQIAEHLTIHEGDVNWFEAAQLVVSARCAFRCWRGWPTWSGTSVCC
ncbi:hypothetical protein [Aestuariimicrobium ganziense]|uniref:hypothetical protein n=1 Tax=Aestuariimicrobium ganziense TaxID=2773677 RepID=UPI001F3EC349|nr:hypothetical protein [Aestuariimicrobium ganziense]